MSLEVFLSSRTMSQTELRPTTIGDRLSDVGGLLGLLLGVSVVSIAEFVAWDLAIVAYLAKKAYTVVCKKS